MATAHRTTPSLNAPLATGRGSTPYRATANLVGVLFLTSTATFVAGSRLLNSYFSGGAGNASLLAGVVLEAYTGLAVAGIGWAMLALLNRFHRSFARAYLILRVLECVAILGAGTYMLSTEREFVNYDLMIYSFTATGGICFAYVLHRSRLIPRTLARLGLGGYIVLLIGIPTALSGVVDINEGIGTAFFVPGGLFELVLPFFLFFKGFTLDEGPERTR